MADGKEKKYGFTNFVITYHLWNIRTPTFTVPKLQSILKVLQMDVTDGRTDNPKAIFPPQLLRSWGHKKWWAGLGRQRASLSEPHLLSHSDVLISCRYKVRDTYVLTPGAQASPIEPHITPVSREKRQKRASEKRCSMLQEAAKSQNKSKEWNPKSAKILVALACC